MKVLVFALMAAAAPEAAFNPFDTLALESAVEVNTYRNCLAQVEEDAQAARDTAEQWVVDGGGPAAMHCHAIADLAAGYPRLAAVRLMQIAERKDAGDTLIRARYLEQAALAWLEAEELDHASAAIDEAQTMAPNSGELSLTAGLVHAANENWNRAADAISAAEEQGFRSAAGYVARGRAHKALTKHREAAQDVVAALSIDPFHLDALVLRGELQQIGISIDANYKRSPQ